MVALLAFGVGCDTGDNNLPTKPVEECYIGPLSVDQNDGTFYHQSNVKATYEISAEGKLNFVMYSVKFAKGMPIKLNMNVDGVDIVEEDGQYTLSGNDIVPYVKKLGPFEKFTITNLTGTLTEESFSLEFLCGEYPVTYNGVWR